MFLLISSDLCHKKMLLESLTIPLMKNTFVILSLKVVKKKPHEFVKVYIEIH